MIVFQMILQAFTLLAIIMYYATHHYGKKKEKEYGNDERWQAIVAASAKVQQRYYLGLLCLAMAGSTAHRFIDIHIQLMLYDVFGLFLVALFGASGVQLMALVIYDKKM